MNTIHLTQTELDRALKLLKTDPDAAWRLIEPSFNAAVEPLLSTYHVQGYCKDDLKQDLTLKFLKDLKKAKIDVEACPFIGWIFETSKRRVIDLIKKSQNLKARPSKPTASLDVWQDSESRIKDLIEAKPEMTIDEEQLLMMTSALNAMSPLERAVALGLGDGESYAELAKRFNTTVKAIDNAKNRITRKGKLYKDIFRSGLV